MITLCRCSDIPEQAGRGFELAGYRVFAVRHRGEIHVYLNWCPHQGTPLDWNPHAFFDPGGHYLQCSTHGALFEANTGKCVAGPCIGQNLRTVAHQIREGEVLIDFSPK